MSALMGVGTEGFSRVWFGFVTPSRNARGPQRPSSPLTCGILGATGQTMAEGSRTKSPEGRHVPLSPVKSRHYPLKWLSQLPSVAIGHREDLEVTLPQTTQNHGEQTFLGNPQLILTIEMNSIWKV